MTFTKIKIVTDSVSDIPPDLLKKWDIAVIPTYVNYDGQSYLDDGVHFDRSAFYNALPGINPYPTTAAPSPGIAEAVLREALAEADHVISIHVPEKLSGTLNAIRVGGDAVDTKRITYVDSYTLSIGTGFQVLVAAEVAAETGDIQQVLDAIRRVQQNQKVYAAIAAMEALKRSGRVNALVASVGTLLQIKPIVIVGDSAIEPLVRVRTFRRALDKLVELGEAEGPLDKLAILHINNPTDAEKVKDRLAHLVPEENIFTGQIGPTLGTHIGPGTVGIATLRKSWRI